jgi:hypothetical protein
VKRIHFTMTTKKKVWLGLSALAGLALAIFYFSLPGISKNFLAAEAEKIGLKNLQFKVAEVGWRRLVLSDITVGGAADPALRIPFLSLEYTLAGIWQKKIRNVRVVGARITFADHGQGLQFQGIAAPPAAPAPDMGMVTFDRLSLEDGQLGLNWSGRSLAIPMDATLRASGPGYRLDAVLHPLGETVRLRGMVDKDFTAGKIAFAVPGFPLQGAIDQAGLGAAASGSGRIAAEGTIIVGEGNFKTAAVSISGLGELCLAHAGHASIILDSFSLAFNFASGFSVRDIVAGMQGRRLHVGEMAAASPFRLDIRGRRWPDLEFSIQGLQVSRPLPLGIERIAGTFNGPWSTPRISGDFALQAGAGILAALGLPGEITRPYAVDGDFQGRLEKGKAAWTMKARGKRNFSVVLGRGSLRGGLELNASLKGDAQRLHASVACRMPAADLRLPGYRARADSFSGGAELDYVLGGDFQGRGLVDISGGAITAAAVDSLEASGIQLKMPWHWPGSGIGAAGGFSIARLRSNGTSWRDISGVLAQEGKSLRFSGSLRSILETITATFQGRYALGPAGGGLQAAFTFPPAVLPARTSLQPLHPLLQGFSCGGRFQAEGRLESGNGSAGGSAVIKMTDADFEQPKAGIVLSGVKAEIKLVDLFALVTAPSQRIDFRELRWQDMLLSNGGLVFAGESGGAFFIESAHFDWCQGKIVMAPLRIKPGATDFLLTFHCERINFAQMLDTLLGKATVSGDAEMSGIVPVRLVNGSPVFLDGYLSSTPGSGGNLKVVKPELIANGQVLVEEAIRDFRYNWIKVKLGSRNDRLDLVVSMDGAPARKLPLRYDPKQKNFLKDPSGGRHVELKGLLLEIRFNDLDLKDLLKASSQMTVGRQENK